MRYFTQLPCTKMNPYATRRGRWDTSEISQQNDLSGNPYRNEHDREKYCAFCMLVELCIEFQVFRKQGWIFVYFFIYIMKLVIKKYYLLSSFTVTLIRSNSPWRRIIDMDAFLRRIFRTRSRYRLINISVCKIRRILTHVTTFYRLLIFIMVKLIRNNSNSHQNGVH